MVDRLVKYGKVIHVVPQFIARNSPVVPLVEILEDPQISKASPKGITAKYELTQQCICMP